jgi:hypothetical protein
MPPCPPPPEKQCESGEREEACLSHTSKAVTLATAARYRERFHKKKMFCLLRWIQRICAERSRDLNYFFSSLSLGPQIDRSSSRECDGLRGVLPACLLPLTTLTLVFREEEGRGASAQAYHLANLQAPIHTCDTRACFAHSRENTNFLRALADRQKLCTQCLHAHD